MNPIVKEFSEDLITASSATFSNAWETLCSMSGEEASKLLLAAMCSPDRILADSELFEFAIRCGAIED